MTVFATADVLSTSTGRLLGDIGGVYKVTSFLLGRDAYTHELAYYHKQASIVLKAAIPELSGPAEAEHVNADNYCECLAEWKQQFGPTIDLPDSLKGCLADNKNMLATLDEMLSVQP